MKKLVLTLMVGGCAAFMLAESAMAQDASKEPVVEEETIVIDGTPNAGTPPPVVAEVPPPTQTTVIVPAARDAITGEVVSNSTAPKEEPKSLRDRVRSKLEKDKEQ